MKTLSSVLKITGIVAIALGIILQFADLKGYLNDKNRMEILNWILHSNTGLSLEHPAAKKFIKKFPPASEEKIANLTHLTKNVIRQENGGIYNASINYMRTDHTRTNFVATLDDVRKWASETPYQWIAWWVTLVGFIELVGNWIIDKKLKTHNRVIGRS